MLVNKFNAILKASAQWDRWIVKLSSTFKSIIGSKRIPMAYTIRIEYVPKLSDHTKWDNK